MAGKDCHTRAFQTLTDLEQITFEMLHISKFSFSRKMRFAAVVGESTSLTNGDSDYTEQDV